LYKKLGNKTGEAHCLGNIGILNLKTKDYEKSIEYNQQAFEYYDQNNMRQNAIIALVDIGIAYDSLNNSQKAFQHYQNAYARTDTSEMLSLRVELELVLSTYYKTQGNYKKALDHHARYLDGSLALIEKENSQKLDELLTKYETEQKEKRIELLEKQQKIDRIMNLSWFGLFVSFLIISAILFYNYKRKQRHNRLLEERNKQILQQKEEITTQNEILQQQKEEITSQRDEIESKQYILLKQKHKLEMVHKELTNSIHYAKYIQSASLPTTKNLQEILNEYFIFFQPQNIVGGDFYWTLKKNGKVFVAAADCTGHGVPGGFMSMLGMTFLDEIVHREGIEEVDQILNRLRQLVIDSLHQKNTLGTLKDGMYLGLCCLDREKGVLEYAGANTPLYIVYENIAKENSDTIISQNNLHLEEVKPDLMPISIHPRIRSFQKQVFPMNDIKALYMSTDGYTDQFGGEKRKKFGKKAFKNMLLTVADKTMEKQQQIITQTYEQWKGENEQIDDVMVMGVRISFK
jgi:serine phosphatase RsbU (regulator of sigma subunit)